MSKSSTYIDNKKSKSLKSESKSGKQKAKIDNSSISKPGAKSPKSKYESTKSTKSVPESFGRGRNSASPKVGGYEVVGATKGTKAAVRDTGGYEFPKMAKKTALGGGYDLITPKKPAASGYDLLAPKGTADLAPKGAAGAQPVSIYGADDYDEEPKQKRAIGFTVLVIVFVIVVLVLITVGIIGVYYLISVEVPLPNVTEQCQRAQVAGYKHRKCVYHRDKYPTNCKQTSCQSVVLKVNFKVADNELSASVGDDKDVLGLNKALDDETPCDKNKWCMKGLCVPTTDERVKKYADADKVHGGWRNVCDENTFDCLEFDEQLFVDSWKRLQSCASYTKDQIFCIKGYQDELKDSIMYFKPGFRVCDNPLPSRGGDRCWDKIQHPGLKNDVFDSMFIARRCSTCMNKTTITGRINATQDQDDFTCLTTDNTGGKEPVKDYNGVRCHFKNAPGLCLYGFCHEDIGKDGKYFCE